MFRFIGTITTITNSICEKKNEKIGWKLFFCSLTHHLHDNMEWIQSDMAMMMMMNDNETLMAHLI